MAANDTGSESEPDFDYQEDAMFTGYLPQPVIDPEALEEQLDAVHDAAVERLAQFEHDQRLRRRLQRRALINRFRRMRGSANFQYQVRILETFREVREYFAHRHHFRWLKTMHGVRPNRSAGAANLYAELDVERGGAAVNDTVEKRRIVVKHAEDPARLWNEIGCLALLGELEHVVNVVSLGDEDDRAESAGLGQFIEEDDDVEGSDNNWEVLENTEGEDSPGSDENEDIPPVPIQIEDSSQPPGTLPTRPTLVLEYMEMGDLNEFRKRMKAAGVNPPNRLLWRILLCLLRSCAGLAHYNAAPTGRESVVQGNNPQPLAHGSLDLSHLLIGSLQPGDDDHNRVPVIKMCSFGDAEDQPEQDRGYIENQLAIGRILQTIALPSSDAADQEEDGLLPLMSSRVPIRMSKAIETYVHVDFWNAPHVTFGLKALVATLMAQRTEDRWTLQQLLRRVAAVNKLSAERNFGDQEVPESETNEGIAQFVQTYMFDASANPPPLTTIPAADPWDNDGGDDNPDGLGLASIIESTFGGWLGTGRNRGPDDLDPASFDIPDLPIDPLPPGFVPPDPDREVEQARLGILRNNVVYLGQNRGRRGRR